MTSYKVDRPSLLFDLWGTLAYHNTSIGYFDTLLKLLGTEDEESFWAYYRNTWLIDSSAPLDQFISRMCAHFHAPEGAADQIYGLTIHDVECAELYPDVMEALKDLNNKYKFGLVSNTGKLTREILRNLGVYDFFDHITLSCEIGILKPDTRIFYSVLSGLNVRPTDACMIGNNPMEDLYAAKRIGMKTVLVGRDNEHETHGFVDITVNDLRDIREALSSL